ncbi:uncharacterized protein LOC131877190 [Tigriopus californicus]|uniref:uncharacterized protein LOC131877190 n=1 Tax=Tigriopus californicus TaxID=6832 RepID=UPI0027DA480E|nr:uncharacterized protein LOC131877190 [Tigriopus californicus]
MTLSFASLTVLVAMVALTLGQQEGLFITSIEVKTADGFYSSMTLGFIDIEIINKDVEICRISHLNSDENDFTQNQINEFDGSDLEECRDFPLPGNEIALLRLIHSGPDAWTPEWVRVYNNNGTFLECPDGAEIDNSETHDLNCA